MAELNQLIAERVHLNQQLDLAVKSFVDDPNYGTANILRWPDWARDRYHHQIRERQIQLELEADMQRRTRARVMQEKESLDVPSK